MNVESQVTVHQTNGSIMLYLLVIVLIPVTFFVVAPSVYAARGAQEMNLTLSLNGTQFDSLSIMAAGCEEMVPSALSVDEYPYSLQSGTVRPLSPNSITNLVYWSVKDKALGLAFLHLPDSPGRLTISILFLGSVESPVAVSLFFKGDKVDTQMIGGDKNE